MKLKITVDGKDYDVEVEVLELTPSSAGASSYSRRPAAGPVRPGAPRAASASKGSAKQEAPVAGPENAVASPIAGNVAKLLVEVGADVTEGQPVVVLEAMKMEQEIESTKAGKVKALHVAVGDAVKKGQVLVEFE